MNKLISKFAFPWITLATGVLGFLLSRLLYTDGQDGARLLETGHPSGILLLILSAAVLAFLAFAVWKLPKTAKYDQVFPKSVSRGIGRCIGAVGIAYTCIVRLSETGFLSVLVLVLGIIAAFLLLFSGTQRFFDIRPHYLLYAGITVYTMALGLSQCRDWGVQTQVLRYLFCLLGTMFLILTSYHHTVFAYNGKNLRSLLFCSNAALFFCLVAYPAKFDLFYLTSAVWMGLDTRPTGVFAKE